MKVTDVKNITKAGSSVLGTVIINGDLTGDEFGVAANLEVKGTINGSVTALGYVKFGALNGTVSEYECTDDYYQIIKVYGGKLAFSGNVKYDNDGTIYTDDVVKTVGSSFIYVNRELHITVSDPKAEYGFKNSKDVTFTMDAADPLTVIAPSCKHGILNFGTLRCSMGGHQNAITVTARDAGIYNNEGGTILTNSGMTVAAIAIADKNSAAYFYGTGIYNCGNFTMDGRSIICAIGTSSGIRNVGGGRITIKDGCVVDAIGAECGFEETTNGNKDELYNSKCGYLHVEDDAILRTNGMNNVILTTLDEDPTAKHKTIWNNKNYTGLDGLLWVDGLIEISNVGKNTQLISSFDGTGCIKVDGTIIYGKEPKPENDEDS